ncbi:MAG: response regulator transcription factor [Sphingobacteriales bacterium]|nr:MAG: response regulator transcription factor [Sphingobacteriales bacterium]
MNEPQITVALADDHTILREGLIRIISNFPGVVVVADANDGKALVDRIGKLETLPDIVLIDVNMPTMDGYTTARELKRRWPELRILALSMYEHEENIIKMLRSGANGYVLKNIKPAELQNAIRHLKYNEFYYSDIVTGRLLNMVYQEEDTEPLTDRELEFLKYCCMEKTYKEIAELMHLSPRTIDGYRDALFKKLNITSRVGLAIFAIRIGAHVV